MSWESTLMAAGAMGQAGAQKSAASYNASWLRQESSSVASQYEQEEASQRRRNALQTGNMEAAAAQAGISSGPSAQMLEKQSIVNQELDALNLRYMGQVRATTYAAQAQNVQNEGGIAATNSYLRAGGALLKGIGGGYGGGGGGYSLADYAQ